MYNKDVEILWIARYDYQPGWILTEHEHNYYQMIYVIDGNGEFIMGNERWDISKEILFMIKPGIRHGLVAFKDGVLKTLDIKFYIEEQNIVQKLEHTNGIFPRCQPEIRLLLERIRAEGLNKDLYYKEFSKLYLKQILLLLIRRMERTKTNEYQEPREVYNGEKDPICNKVIEYFRKHYSTEVTLDEMARELGYHPSYICQVFKEVMHCTPMQYLYKYRVEKAKELIMYSDFALKHIAELTGFKTIHHFTRVFRQYEGITPGQFRDKEKEGIRKDIYFADGFVNINFTKKV
ncbi:MAG: AraC family transcriptional regulator [Thermoanaerobacterium sp.]|nr:AraC family transcriptional regulator [Thermoanaerobacterium sp.]